MVIKAPISYCKHCSEPVYCKELCQYHYNRNYQGLPIKIIKMDRQYNREELAWAAGLWDGECSTSFCTRKNKTEIKRYIRMSMGQKAENKQVLERFHNAIGGLGTVSKPYKVPTGYRCDWRLGSFEGCQATIALLWHWLSPEKRTQAKKILLEQV